MSVGRMKAERKKVTLTQILSDAQTGVMELVVDRPKAWFAQSRERLHNLPKTNFDLGCDFAERGKWYDALFRFRVAAYFQPAYPQVWYNIGCCYYRLGKLEAAKAALLKALAQKPGQADAVVMLAAIDPSALAPNQRPTRLPQPMVSGFFASLAANYDIEEARNKYQAGKLVYDLVKPLVKAAAPRVLDLGCGTGIVSRPWRSSAASITGVDFTPEMLALAGKATHEQKKLFDQLITADIAVLAPSMEAASADVVLCVNVAQFVGELSGLMQGVARVLAPEGLLVLTAEPHSAAADYGISATTGRFGHSPAYVKQVASAVGLTLVKETSLSLYPETKVGTYLFSKGGI